MKEEYILINKNEKRVFINTSLGCEGKCSYCYLPTIGINNNDLNKVKSASSIIKEIKLRNIDNTWLISFGCFSECWSEKNKKETIKLLRYFLSNGNQIQLSTKKQINLKEIKSLFKYIKYKGQLVIFISSSTISKCDEIESNTDLVDNRFKLFKLSMNYPIVTVLYIKPVLKDITICDINLYKKYIKKYKITDVVVGSIFTTEESKEKAPFTNQTQLYYSINIDEKIIINELSKISNVFTRSTKVMKKYKQKVI